MTALRYLTISVRYAIQFPYYGNWIASLTDMVKYLNAVMFLKEDAYPLLRSSLKFKI